MTQLRNQPKALREKHADDFTQPTGNIWRVTTAETHFPQPIADIAVDVAVVGGGITGMTAALLLARAGLKVAVIEAGKIGTGTTGHSSGQLRDVPPAGYQQPISSAGAENASLAVQSCRAAPSRIAAFIQDEGISCHFQRVPAFLYTESREDLSYLEDEMEAARGLGVDATLTASVPLPFRVRAGILLPSQAQFHPAEYLHGLAKAFTGSAGLIFERTRVLDISDSQPCRIYTPARLRQSSKRDRRHRHPDPRLVPPARLAGNRRQNCPLPLLFTRRAAGRKALWPNCAPACRAVLGHSKSLSAQLGG
jgi:hypothetical protein